MTDAQKALDELPIPVHIRLGLGASSGTIVHWYDEHEKTIHRALRLLAAVEVGEWKAVPVEPDECMVYAADLAQEPFCDVDVYPTRDLLKAAIRAAIYAAPDFFAEDGK